MYAPVCVGFPALLFLVALVINCGFVPGLPGASRWIYHFFTCLQFPQGQGLMLLLFTATFPEPRTVPGAYEVFG